MKKQIISLALLMCFAIGANTFAQSVGTTSTTEVGISSNSTVQGPKFTDIFTDITPKSSSGSVQSTGKISMVIQLNGSADVARSWGLTLDSTQAAIDFMFANGLTRFGSVDNFMGDETLRRDQAATFYSRFAAKALGITPDTNKAGCTFSDMAKVDANLKDDVVIACQMGLFKGHDGKFMPTDRLTLGQALTVLIRIIDGYKSETNSTNRAYEYWKSAYALGITHNTTIQLNTFVQRADVAKLLEAAAIVEQVKAKAKAEGYAAILFQNAASPSGGKITLLTDADAKVSVADKQTVVGGLGSVGSRYRIDIK